MTSTLMRAGYRVVGYDLLPARLQQHRRAGGQAASTCADVAEHADIVISSLPSSEALLETAEELAQSPRRRLVVVETSTLPIAVKEEARARLAGAGVTLLDCPLSGTGAQARTGDLVVYASGNRAAYRRAVPVLEAFARAQYYVGPFGAGSKTKFVANLLVAIHNVASAEARPTSLGKWAARRRSSRQRRRFTSQRSRRGAAPRTRQRSPRCWSDWRASIAGRDRVSVAPVSAGCAGVLASADFA